MTQDQLGRQPILIFGGGHEVVVGRMQSGSTALGQRTHLWKLGVVPDQQPVVAAFGAARDLAQADLEPRVSPRVGLVKMRAP